MGFWLFFLMLVLLVLALPWWPYSRGWGYWPGGALQPRLILLFALAWWGFLAVLRPWAA